MIADPHEFNCTGCGRTVITTGPQSPVAQDGRCPDCRTLEDTGTEGSN